MRRHLSWMVYVVILSAGFLVTMGLNMLWNNREIIEEEYTSKSITTGLVGHVEYTSYKDGSQDVKVYHGLGHRLFGSELHQDLDGDDEIDRIRYNAPEWRFNRLTKILIKGRDTDSVFIESNKRLRELKE